MDPQKQADDDVTVVSEVQEANADDSKMSSTYVVNKEKSSTLISDEEKEDVDTPPAIFKINGVSADVASETDAWSVPVPSGSFSMENGEMTWTTDFDPGHLGATVAGTEEECSTFSTWFEEEKRKTAELAAQEEEEEEFQRENVEIFNITEPRQAEFVHWYDMEHSLEEWVEIVKITFDDIAPESLIQRGRDLIKRGQELGYIKPETECYDEVMKNLNEVVDAEMAKYGVTPPVPEEQKEDEEIQPFVPKEKDKAFLKKEAAIVKDLRAFFKGRMLEEKAWFKGEFGREGDYMEVEHHRQFCTSHFRVRGVGDTLAYASFAADTEDTKKRFKEVRALAYEDRERLLWIKIKSRTETASTKEELQRLMDFLRTLEWDNDGVEDEAIALVKAEQAQSIEIYRQMNNPGEQKQKPRVKEREKTDEEKSKEISEKQAKLQSLYEDRGKRGAAPPQTLTEEEKQIKKQVEKQKQLEASFMTAGNAKIAELERKKDEKEQKFTKKKETWINEVEKLLRSPKFEQEAAPSKEEVQKDEEKEEAETKEENIFEDGASGEDNSSDSEAQKKNNKKKKNRDKRKRRGKRNKKKKNAGEVSKGQKVIGAKWVPPTRIVSWVIKYKNEDKEAMKAAFESENEEARVAEKKAWENEEHSGKKQKPKLKSKLPKKGKLTTEQSERVKFPKIDLTVNKAMILDEATQAKKKNERVDFHRLDHLINAEIPAKLVVKTVSCSSANAPRKWQETNINLVLPCSMGNYGNDLVIGELGKARVFHQDKISRYYSRRNGVDCDEQYFFDDSIKFVGTRISSKYIGFLVLMKEAEYQLLYLLNRKTLNVRAFGSPTSPLTCFTIDEDEEHVWLGFANGLVAKMNISTGKREEAYWITSEIPVQVIARRGDRILAGHHQGVVMFNNVKGYEDERRIVMPVGPAIDLKFYGNMMVMLGPDNSVRIVNLMTYSLEAFIPAPETFSTSPSQNPYPGIVLTNDHLAIFFPEGNAAHLHLNPN